MSISREELEHGVRMAESLRRSLAANVVLYGAEAYKLADNIERDLRRRLADLNAPKPGDEDETVLRGGSDG